MPTLKSTRAAPSRRFDDYVFTRTVSHDAKLSNIDVRKLSEVPTAGAADADDALSSTLDIGFEFQINGRSHRQFVVCSNGWMVLLDPTRTTFASSDILTTGILDNTQIKATFVYNHVLLAPWFDDIKNTSNSASTVFGAAQATRTSYGIDYTSSIIYYDQTNYGVKYCSDTDEHGVKRLVVRWHSHSYFDTTTSREILTYEVVLYENGNIEYRYAPPVIKISGDADQGTGSGQNATIGIFMPETNTFRDLTSDLGYAFNLGATVRTESYNGGYVYVPGQTDSTGVPYATNLTVYKHWPARGENFAIYRFTAPQGRRKELPRKTLRDIDSNSSYDRRNNSSLYDDRQSVAFITGTFINAPLGLPRRFMNGSNTSARYVDLYGSGSIEFVSSIRQGPIENYVVQSNVKRITPFTDDNRPEQSNISLSYFGTGSNISEFGDSLLQPLKSKTQIKISLPITKTTTMFEYTSSLYYYNSQQRSWFIPQNAQGSKDLANAIYSIDRYWPEDARGFGPLGNVVSSGTTNLATQTFIQTSPNWGPLVYSTPQTRAAALTGEYNKSIQVNAEYKPSVNELITAPISQPFLIEKAVIEIPFQAGQGWFTDKTTCGRPVIGGAPSSNEYTYDFAGPAITLSLFNHRTSGAKTFNDLILTGTIVPVGDTHKNVKIQYTDPQSVRLSPEGYTSFNATPAAVVIPNNDNQFTGTVSLQTIAAVSNGIIAKSQNGSFSISSANYQKNFLSARYVDMADRNIIHRIYSVNPFGRSSQGFDPSGRSTFGKEYATFESTVIENKILNPLFVSSSYAAFPTHIREVFDNPTLSSVVFEFILTLDANSPSPYLIMPGDKLYIGLSKMRPFMYGDGTEVGLVGATQYFTGSGRHDVVLPTGSINITLYGSLLRENREYHSGLNQNLTSDAIHGVIGNQSIIDQHDVDYRGLYAGTTFDDYITGSLVTQQVIDGKRTIAVGTRGRVFSKFNARAQSVPVSTPTASYEVVTNRSKAFRQQPWYEKVSSPYNSQCVAYNERMWDSMIPNLVECWDKDNTKPCGTVSNSSIGDWPIPYGVNVYDNVGEFAIMGFDFDDRTGAYDPEGSINRNSAWTRSYPFEPRYNAVPRQYTIDKATSMTVDVKLIDITSAPTVIKPTQVKSFLPVFGGTVPRSINKRAGDTSETAFAYSFGCDVSLGSHLNQVTGSTENFQGVTPPALPATTVALGTLGTWDRDSDASDDWITVTSASFGHTGATTTLLASDNVISTGNAQWVWVNYISNNPFRLSFWWKISAHSTDTLVFSYQASGDVTNTFATITGNSGWRNVETGFLDPGTYIFQWKFTKVAAGAALENRGWVDDIEIIEKLPVTGSMSAEDLTKVMFGFGDMNTVTWQEYTAGAPNESKLTYGTNHLAEFRHIHNDVWPIVATTNSNWMMSPRIRGWKYGLSSGLPEYSRITFRRNSYGQFRDMLEQRPYTKFYQPYAEGGRPGNSVLDGPVTVRFVDQNGSITAPERTWSCNLSAEATSSVPYVEGELRNRGTIDVTNLNLNTSIISFV